MKSSASASLSALSNFFGRERNYYDAAGRRTQTTSFGSNEGGLNGGMKNGVVAASISGYSTPETRSDFFLVTTWTYDAKGRLEETADPDNKETSYEYDALGRRTAMVEDASGLARRTEYQYNGNSDTTKLIARDVDEYGYSGGDALEDQVTQYVYGHAVNSRWVTEIRYPGSDGQASSSSADKVVFTYHDDGTVNTRTDQNGSVITYNYDSLRRKTHELAALAGGNPQNVDNAVLQIVTTFDSSGRVQKLTSRDSSTADSGNIVNEVKYTYNGYGQLTKDEQEHDGAVDGSTLSVQYAYTEDTGNNHSRLSYMTYPNGRTIYHKYTHSNGGSNWQDETNDAFSRVGQIAGSASSDIYAEYTFSGLGRMMKRASKFDTANGFYGNDTALDYDAGTPGDYTGIDLFGRVAKSPVNDSTGSTTRTDIQYNANRDSSPKFAQPQSATVKGRSNLYSYDGLHRLSQADTGTLNSGRTDILTEWSDPSQTLYTMDILGNFTSIDRKNSGTSASETRVHNATNELTSRTVTGEAARYWANDDFADNDTLGYAVADLNTGGSDGTWGAGSGALACSATCTPTGHSSVPGGGACSVILVDGPYYQDVFLTASGTISTSGPDIGLIFGYRDNLNFWCRKYSLAGQTVQLYEVSAGTWTQRSTAAQTITAGVAFTMQAQVRAGVAVGYATTLPAGQVGLISFGSSNNSFDDFKVRDLAGPYEVDGRWFAEVGDVQVDSGGYPDVLSINSTVNQPVPVVRRGFRAETFVMTFKFYWSTPCKPGAVFGYLDPSNWWAVYIDSSDGKARLIQRADDGPVTTIATDTTVLSLSNNNWYTAKLVVEYQTGFPFANVACLWVDTDNDADFSDETTLLGAAVTGSVGYCGVFRHNEGTNVAQYDDVKIGTDNSGPKDGDFADGGDEVAIDDNFNSAAIAMAYDNNGNLTDDGIFKFVYDAWNRLVKAKHRSASNAAAIGTYAYDGAMRRQKKAVTNQGPEATANDGGNTTVVYSYDHRWRTVEDRNGSNQTMRQHIGGTRYIDEHIWLEVNGDPTIGNDTTPDVSAAGEASESPADDRFVVHQDRNWSVIALSKYDSTGSSAGALSATFTYRSPYGGPQVLISDLVQFSGISWNGFDHSHQGLSQSTEIAVYDNRYRLYSDSLGKFYQRDLYYFVDSGNSYLYLLSSPTNGVDPHGTLCQTWDPELDRFVPCAPTPRLPDFKICPAPLQLCFADTMVYCCRGNRPPRSRPVCCRYFNWDPECPTYLNVDVMCDQSIPAITCCAPTYVTNRGEILDLWGATEGPCWVVGH